MKRYVIGLLTLLAFAFAAPAGAFAQNSLDVVNASGDPASSGNIVHVDMTNVESVSGIQFTLRAVSPDLEPTDVRLGTRFLGRDFDASSTLFAGGDSVRVVIVSLSGDSIVAGSGTIAEILFDVAPGATPGSTTDLTLNDIVVSDPIGGLVEGTNTSGIFSIITTTPSSLSADNVGAILGETGLVTVSLDNLDDGREVAALQFTLTDLPDNLDVVDGEGIEVSAVGRASGFTVGANETEDGVVVTLTDLNGGTIAPGSGPIVTINYWANRGSGLTTLDFADVIISDEDAVEMPQGTHTSGSFTINVPPTIAAIPDPEPIDEDAGQQNVNLSGITAGGGESQDLKVTVLLGAGLATGGATYTSPDETGTVSYTPDIDFNGTTSVLVTVTDAGPDGIDDDGNGDDASTTVSFDVTIDSVNDAPSIAGPSSESTDEDMPLIFSTANGNLISISDPDVGEGDMDLSITALSTVSLSTLAGLAGEGDGTSELSYTGTLGAINAALDGLIYTPTSNQNGEEAGGITISIDDKGNSGVESEPETDQLTIAIDLNPVNDVPLLSNIEVEPVTFTEDGGPVQVTGSLNVNDDDEGEPLQGATVTILNYVPGQDVLDFVPDEGITGAFDSETGILSLTGSGGEEEYELRLRSVTYENTSDNPSTATRTIAFVVDDGVQDPIPGAASGILAVSDAVTRDVVIIPVNDPPSVTSSELADALQDIAYSFTVTAEDPEGNDITFGLGVAPEWLSINPETGQLGGTPAISDTGNTEVEVRVSDGEDSSSTVIGLDVIRDSVAPAFTSGPSDQGVTDTQFTVVFSSNEEVTGVVRYGILNQQTVPPSTNGTLALTDSVVIVTADTEQSVEITGLTGATTYEYQVEISDGNGNRTISQTLLATTLASPDSTEPNFVKLPQAVATTDSALTIAWAADEAATAVVRLVRANGDTLNPNIIAATTSFEFNNQITISGLKPSTEYDGQVELTDASGNGPDTEPFDNNPARITARTRATPDTKAPVFTAAPTVKGITDKRATVLSSTNEPAGVVVQYGLTTGLGSQVADSARVSNQSVTLTGLKPDSTYNYRVQVFDGSGNFSAFTPLRTFRTRPAPDTSPPVITSGPSVISVSDVSIIVKFTTNELGNTVLRYKKVGGADSTTINRPDPVIDHVVTLTGLSPNTSYKYTVSSTDGSGNRSAERSGTVTTKTEVDTRPPRFQSRPVVTFKSSDRFRVAWRSDEASGSSGRAGITRTDSTIQALDQDLVNDHVLTFTDLVPNTVYFWRVSMQDANGNRASSALDSIRTSPAPDTTPPGISQITASAELSQAVIAFTTSETGNTLIIVGSDSVAVASGDKVNAEVFEVPAFTVKHSTTVTGLTASTKYFYRVQSTDPAGNSTALVPSEPRDFTTDAAPDTRAPVISAVSVSSVTSTEATISFRTNELSSTSVIYDTTSGDLSLLAEIPDLVTDHLVTLTNLIPGKRYRFRVLATDQSDNTAQKPGGKSPGRTFPTPPEITDTIAPLFIERPNLDYTSNTTAIISFKTDEPTDATIFYKADIDSLFISVSDPAARVTNHDVAVSGLSQGTTYDFVVQVSDAEGNSARFPNRAIVFKVGPNLFKIINFQQGPGTNGRFTTLQAPDTQAPVILNGPSITSRDDNSITIQWITDELSTTTVDFGTDTNNLDQRSENGTLVTTHAMNITGLSPSTVYSYAVSSTDPSNNGPSTSSKAVVSTTSQPDVSPPVISAGPSVSSVFVSSADGASATITWTTDEPSDTKVEFGTTSALGEVKAVSEAVTSHSVTITRLTAGAAYNYRVSSTDQTGNGPTTSGILLFTAADQTDSQAPVLSNISTANSSNNRISVSWDTDELATTILLAIEQGTSDTITVVDGAFLTSHSISITQDNSGNAIKSATTYNLVVESIDASDNTGLQNTTVTTAAAADTTAPAIPSNVAAVPGNAQVQVTWDVVGDGDISGYDVYQDGTRVASGVTTTTYDATGLTNGTAVNYAIQSVDQSGNSSGNSSTVSATPLATLAPTAPTPIGTFDRTGTPLTTVSLKPILIVSNATPVDGRAEATYTFAVYGDAGLTNLVASTSGVVQGTSSNPTHWQVTDPTLPDDVALVDGTTYYWRARANDNVTDGEWSSSSSFIASSEVETSIELTAFSADTDRGMVSLSWQTVFDLGIEGFSVYRSVNAEGPFELVSSNLIRGIDGAYEFNDFNVAVNVTYYYQIEVSSTLEADSRFGPISIKVAPPNSYAMDQNFPNPFNPTTSIRYELPQSGHVQLTVYNILGQEVTRLVDAAQTAGFHTIQWNGLNGAQRRVSSGLYLYRIAVKVDGQTTFSTAKKMLLLK